MIARPVFACQAKQQHCLHVKRWEIGPVAHIGPRHVAASGDLKTLWRTSGLLPAAAPVLDRHCSIAPAHAPPPIDHIGTCKMTFKLEGASELWREWRQDMPPTDSNFNRRWAGMDDCCASHLIHLHDLAMLLLCMWSEWVYATRSGQRDSQSS